MHLAIDASRTTNAHPTGTERYALEMIRALIPLINGRLTLYFRDVPPRGLFPDSAECRVLHMPRLWTHTRLALQVALDRPDVLWVPAHTLPFAFPGRAAVTVHDLGYLHFPDAHPPRQRAYLDWTTRSSARRAAIVLADSRATATDLTRAYRIPPERIRVVYPGVNVPPVQDVPAVARKLGLPERYFLFLGTLQPRKNIARLVQAYQRWQAEHPGDPAALVLAGRRGWLYDPAWTANVPGVIEPGYVADEDRGALYAGALALVFPSLYEGFGFPVLEAMGCETPVIASATSSLPELAGDAALLVNPLDVEEIASAMGRLSDRPEEHDRLVRAGLRQVEKFTWAAAAEAAWAALQEAAS